MVITCSDTTWRQPAAPAPAPAQSQAWDGCYLPPGEHLGLALAAGAIATARRMAPITAYRKLCDAVSATPPRVASTQIGGELMIPRAEVLRPCAVNSGAGFQSARHPDTRRLEADATEGA